MSQENDNDVLERVINSPNFGNLAKLVVIFIISVGFVVSSVVVIAKGGSLEGYVDASKMFVSFAIAAVTAGSVNAFGKSETAKTILNQRSLEQVNRPNDVLETFVDKTNVVEFESPTK